MTDERINVRVAKILGLPIVSDGITHCLTPCDMGGKYNQDGPLLKKVPNYADDLNACHEFAAWLNLEQQIKFAEELQCIILENPYRAWWDATVMEVFQIADATARQRCEAFLRVHNQWEETK
jgi:hypothetical protein